MPPEFGVCGQKERMRSTSAPEFGVCGQKERMRSISAPELGRLTMRGVLAGESFGEAGEWGGVDEYLLSNIWHFMCSVNGRGDKLGNGYLQIRRIVELSCAE
ncbi:hypothetical protein BK147_05260 [Paenibacillus sp. FSL R7-0337]|nr:hypothetical protein BK147_05260 [Paenibacillus sp. FSL R7-0337]